MRYVKKAVVIEAFQFGVDLHPKWFDMACKKGFVEHKRNIHNRSDDVCLIKTLEGIMTAKVGDYIIQGVKGELYPCKADIFRETYSACE